LGNITSLTSLGLRNNKIEDVPEELGALADLQELDLRGNPISCIPKALKKLGGGTAKKKQTKKETKEEKEMKEKEVKTEKQENPEDVKEPAGKTKAVPAEKGACRIWVDLPDKILPRLYLGSSGAAGNQNALKHLKISHILTVASQCADPPFPKVLLIYLFSSPHRIQL